jgi:tetraacyldisaccharide 4'-kinase
MDRHWYRLSWATLLLAPLSVVFALAVGVRRLLYRMGLFKTHRFPVPVVVVGNLTVGGTGKTPLVIWLVQHLKSKGYRPGIVSRGYGGGASHWPQQVRGDSDPVVVGDEAVILAARTGQPVCVAPDRPAAIRALLQHHDCDIVLSDDGLQHYAMGRDIEIVVVDAERRFGNGLLLPAGPLREPRSRLKRADLVIYNGNGGGDRSATGMYTMRMRQPQLVPLRVDSAPVDLNTLAGCRVHAVAGIGNPQRFFELLRRYGLNLAEHRFPDHHRFKPEEIRFEDDLPVIMTEKDAVKCRRFADSRHLALRVDAQPDARFVLKLNQLLDGLPRARGEKRS